MTNVKISPLPLERPLGPNEKGITRIGKKTYKEQFIDELHAYEQKYTKEHKPFDRACARADFEDKYDITMRELERTEGFANEEDIRLKISLGDLNKYGNLDRFEKIADVEDVVNRNIDGVIIPTLVGFTEQYICKQRKHRIGVSVPAKVVIKQ